MTRNSELLLKQAKPTTRRPASISIFLLLLIILASSLHAVGPSYIGQAPSDAPSSFQIGSQGAHNGQYTQSFPLYSLATQNGPRVDLALNYSSNVSRIVKLNNHEFQVSWVGLGFEMGGEAITVDPNYTTDIADDRYFYIGPHGTTELIMHSSGVYYPENGTPYRFERTTTDVNGRLFVEHWLLKKEDGTKYYFGDDGFYNAVRNATRYTNYWGSTVGLGVAGDDSLIAYQWDLRRIESVDGASFLNYEYSQELDSLSTHGAGTFTEMQYTRASIPSLIESSTGESIRFVLGMRSDTLRYFANASHEFFSTRKLDTLCFIGSSGQTLSRIGLTYSYLNEALGNVKQKLLLRQITTFEGDGTDSLPSLRFSYFEQVSDVCLGGLKEILLPTGGAQRISYSVADTTTFGTFLHYQQSITGKDYTSQSFSRNEIIRKFRLSGESFYRYELGTFNGHWNFTGLPDSSYVIDRDWEVGSSVAASDGWVVRYLAERGRFEVYFNLGGKWRQELISPSWSHSAGLEYRIWAGRDFFVVCLGSIEGTTWRTTKGYYYGRVGTVWDEELIYDQSGEFHPSLSNVHLANNLYAVVTDDPEREGVRKVFYGAYDFQANSLVKGSLNDSWSGNYLYVAVGINYLAWATGTQDQQNPAWMNILDYGSGTWRNNSVYGTGVFAEMLGLSSGPIMRTEYLLDGVPKTRIYWFMRTDAGWTTDNNYAVYLNTSDSSHLFGAGGNTFAARVYEGGFKVAVFRWVGENMLSTDVYSQSSSQGGDVVVSDEICVAYSRANHALYAKRYLGDNAWGSTETLATNLYELITDNTPLFDASRDAVVIIGQDAVGNSIRQWCNWTGTTWNITDISNNCPSLPSLKPVVYSDRFLVLPRSGEGDLSAFQDYNGKIIGRPLPVVVSKIESFASGPSGSPRQVSFSYKGGLLDQGVSSPRFSAVYSSDPHSPGSQPNVCHVTRFYNDMDDNAFTVSGLQLPDLQDSTTFGKYDGGYLLDGLPYLEFDSAAADVGEQCFDSVLSFYSLKQPPTSRPNSIASPLLDSTRVRKRKVPFSTAYTYDSEGRLVKTTSDLGSGESRIDSTSYATFGESTNILDRETWQLGFLVKPGDTEFVNRSLATWDSQGFLQRQYSWLDAARNSFTDTIITPRTDLYDFTNSDPCAVQTDSFWIPIDTGESCEYELQFRGATYGEYSLIKRKRTGQLVLMDSLPSPIRFQGNPLVDTSKYGQFSLQNGDSILIKLANDKGHGTGGCGYGTASIVVYRGISDTVINDGGELSSFSLLEDLPNKGRDSYNRLLCWRKSDYDTIGVKYDPDGKYAIATIANAHVNSCQLFSAEYGLPYEGWAVPSGGSGIISTEDALTGYQSLKIVGTTGSSTVDGISRSMVKDSLMGRRLFTLNGWYRTTSAVPNMVVNLVAYHNQTPFDVKNRVFLGSTTWNKLDCTFDLTSQYDNLTSITLTIELTNDNQAVAAFVDDLRFYPVGASVQTSVFDSETSLEIAAAGPDNTPVQRTYDVFHRPTATYDFLDRQIDSLEYIFSSQNPLNSDAYNPLRPNYTRHIVYTGAQPVEEVVFTDGFSSKLQGRTSVDHQGVQRSIVSGVVEHDSQGLTVRSYKPYIDIDASSGVLDFSDSASVLSEANSYYNGTYGTQCTGKPYTETIYRNDRYSSVEQTSQAGPLHALGAGHTTQYLEETKISSGDTVYVATVTDPDGNIALSKTDPRGGLSVAFQRYDRSSTVTDSIAFVNTTDEFSQTTQALVDTGGADPHALIPLRMVCSNDRGSADSTWKVDFGWTHMRYDKQGRLRFVQDEKLDSLNQMVYFRYDGLGRKIEEGVLGNASLFFNETFANVDSFPDIRDTIHRPQLTTLQRKFRWFFDYYSEGTTALVAPGKLVRVDNCGQGYFKNYYYFPAQNYDSVVISLPFVSGGSLKAIKHGYNQDGSIAYRIIYPKLPTAIGSRRTDYAYDQSGRLSKITGPMGSEIYAGYQFNADGSVALAEYGALGDSVLQRLNFAYDPLGRLLRINDTSGVVAGMNGGVRTGNDYDHFAEEILYYDSVSQQGYLNGRIWKSSFVHSGTSGKVTNKWEYLYNRLGWLTKADHETNNNLDARYHYNGLGQLDTLYRYNGTNWISTWYQHGAGSGSSRLSRIQGTTNDRHYDRLGNLSADTSAQIWEMYSDYRQQLTLAYGAPNIPTGVRTGMSFMYDESGLRIRKHWTYNYWAPCQPPPPPEELLTTGGGSKEDTSSLMSEGITTGLVESDSLVGQSVQSIGGGNCLYNTSAQTQYLYDGGELVATFNQSDQVIDLFVTGPGGPIATYHNNSDLALHYFFRDHLGSTRMTMLGVQDEIGFPFTVTSTYDYSAYGQVTQSWSNLATPYQFSGKELDQHGPFSFNYFGARYYDSKLGDFTSVDAAGQFADGYMYGANNPVSAIDPDGNLAALPFIKILQVIGYHMAAKSAVISVMNGNYLGAGLTVAGLFVPTGIPNPYKGANVGYSMATTAMTSSANTILWNAVTGRPWNEGMLKSATTGAAWAGVSYGAAYADAMIRLKKSRESTFGKGYTITGKRIDRTSLWSPKSVSKLSVPKLFASLGDEIEAYQTAFSNGGDIAPLTFEAMAQNPEKYDPTGGAMYRMPSFDDKTTYFSISYTGQARYGQWAAGVTLVGSDVYFTSGFGFAFPNNGIVGTLNASAGMMKIPSRENSRSLTFSASYNQYGAQLSWDNNGNFCGLGWSGSTGGNVSILGTNDMYLFNLRYLLPVLSR